MMASAFLVGACPGTALLSRFLVLRVLFLFFFTPVSTQHAVALLS